MSCLHNKSLSAKIGFLLFTICSPAALPDLANNCRASWNPANPAVPTVAPPNPNPVMARALPAVSKLRGVIMTISIQIKRQRVNNFLFILRSRRLLVNALKAVDSFLPYPV